MARPSDPQEILEFERVLAELANRAAEHQIDPALDRTAVLLDLLGNPQSSFRVVHVAGTNGKTSTSRMIESLLAEAGLSVGLTTSPHLHDVRERIRLHREPIALDRFVETFDDIAPYIPLAESTADRGRISYFETLTAMAFAAFADAPVDVGVIEVGMGGRWDSTNVVQPDVAVITPIGLDHQQYLGDTIAQIAAEKAGIIKPGSVVVCARQDPAALEVISDRAAEMGAALLLQDRDFAVVDRTLAVGGQQLTLRGIGGTYVDILLPLFGEHQADNAAVALAAVEAFFGAGVNGRRISDAIVQAGFAGATSPGRLEVVKRSPTIVVDAAHNPHGAAALVTALTDEFSFDRVVFVVGMLADKDASGFLSLIEPLSDQLICTQSASPRALPAEELAEVAAAAGIAEVETRPQLSDAIARAVEVSDEWAAADLVPGIVICGSVVTVGEARARLGRHSA